jgi:hypothetical protein
MTKTDREVNANAVENVLTDTVFNADDDISQTVIRKS